MADPTHPAATEAWLLDSMQEGYLRVDPAGRVLSANRAASDITQIAPEALIGRSLHGLFPRIPEQALADLIAGRDHEALGASPAGMPLQAVPPIRLVARSLEDGADILIFDQSKALRMEAELAQIKATMAVSQELLRHKNEELDQSLERITLMNEKLAALDELKSEFLSNMSHELRTPLGTIIGSLQLVREGLCESREEEAEYYESALTAANRLLEIINEVLDSAKLSAGKMNFMIEDHPVADLFEEAYSELNPRARQKGLRLTFDVPRPATLLVRSDFEKTRQVLLNIVGNAIKFTEDGEVTVCAGRCEGSEDSIVFRVRDTGIGVPLERQQEIFERFTQIDGSPTRRYEGAGLGLAITRNLIEVMGGTIHIRSEGIGRGCEVEFTLPLGSSPEHAADLAGDAGESDWDERLPRSF